MKGDTIRGVVHHAIDVPTSVLLRELQLQLSVKNNAPKVECLTQMLCSFTSKFEIVASRTQNEIGVDRITTPIDT